MSNVDGHDNYPPANPDSSLHDGESRADSEPIEALTEERRRLAESVTGYAEALAITLSEDVGKHWLPDLRSAAWLGATLAARRYDFTSKATFAPTHGPRSSAP